eukprot:scaffold5772_cov105-Isochrysis_galbana.AAC.4
MALRHQGPTRQPTDGAPHAEGKAMVGDGGDGKDRGAKPRHRDDGRGSGRVRLGHPHARPNRPLSVSQ